MFMKDKILIRLSYDDYSDALAEIIKDGKIIATLKSYNGDGYGELEILNISDEVIVK